MAKYISGKWKIVDISNMSTIPASVTQKVNYIAGESGYDYTHMVIEPSTYVECQKIVNGNYENLSSIVFLEDGVTPFIGVSEIDFGTDVQEVSDEFFSAFTLIADPAPISGVWKFKANGGWVPAPDLTERINYTVDLGYGELSHGNSITFYGDEIAPSHYVHLDSDDGQVNDFAVFEGSVWVQLIDFGTEPQAISEDFSLWIHYMAAPMEEIDGMWEFNETLEFSTLYPLDNDAVDFVYNCQNDLYASFNRLYFDVGGGSYNAMSYMVYGQSGEIVYTTSTKWKENEYRYVQFGEKQYVPAKFKTWLQKNATRLGDYAIEAGDHCFKLDIYNELKEYFGRNIDIPFTFKTPEGSILDCYSMLLVICDYTDNPSLWYMSPAGSWEAYEYSDIDSVKFRALGWRTKYHDRLDGSFQNRFITVTEKTYLPYRNYNFLSATLIPLNSQALLDTVGAWDMIQSVDTVTNLMNKYAKHLTYKPYAETVYFNAEGEQNIEDIDLSKYLYVTIRGSANSANTTISNPVSTTFAVQQIGSSYITVQLADSYFWATWKVYTSKITYSSCGTDKTTVTGQTPKIYEIVGYRFEPHFLAEGIAEPTYAYKYVQGNIGYSPRDSFNTYHNSTAGTEFRFEINFLVTSLDSTVTLLSDGSMTSGQNGYRIAINSSGSLQLTNYHNTSSTTTWSNFTVQPNTWYSLSIYSNSLTSSSTTTSSGTMYASIVPYGQTHIYTSKTISKWSQGNDGVAAFIGGNKVQLRGRILLKGTPTGDNTKQNMIDTNVDNYSVNGKIKCYNADKSILLDGGTIYGVEEE